MTTNERELAQLHRQAPDRPRVDQALLLADIVQRDEAGRVRQYRIVRDATPEDIREAADKLNKTSVD